MRGKDAYGLALTLPARTIEKNVRRLKSVSEIRVNSTGTVRLTTPQGVHELPAIDTVVLAGERRSDRALAELTQARGIATHIVGDASDATSEAAGTIFNSITMAYDRARAI